MKAFATAVRAAVIVVWGAYACHAARRADETTCSEYGAPAKQCVQLNQPFAIETAVGRYLPPGNLRIALSDVVEDSRCPAGVQCVWAGRARLRIRVDSSSYMRTVELRTDSSTAVVFGHTITLDSLLPYPKAGQAIERKDYRAWVHVSRGS